jgi:putative acetyltransferase
MKVLGIRPLVSTDVKDLFTLHRMPIAGRNTTHVPTETEDGIRERFFGAPDPSRHSLGAEVDGRLVGLAGLLVATHPRLRHTAKFFVLVHDDFHGQGVGRALTAAILDLGDKYFGLIRIQLEVNFDNARAIALYEKFGFVVEGRLKGNILRDGEYIDSFVMGRLRPAPLLHVETLRGGDRRSDE